MNNNDKKQLLEAIAVCAELTGTQLSEAAARVMADDLSRYPHAQVVGALGACRRELRGRLTISDIIARLDDGRPGVEEAWATVAPALGNESVTIVWTDEMAAAYGVACNLDGDKVAARMAFREHYEAECKAARAKGVPVKWSACLGHDPAGREGPLLAAAKKGLLTQQHVAGLLPHRDKPAHDVQKLLEGRLFEGGKSLPEQAKALP